MKIPNFITSLFFSRGSLEKSGSTVRFTMKNRLAECRISSIRQLSIDGTEIPLQGIFFVWTTETGEEIEVIESKRVQALEITSENPLFFPIGKSLQVEFQELIPLQKGKHKVSVSFLAEPFGEIDFTVKEKLWEVAQ